MQIIKACFTDIGVDMEIIQVDLTTFQSLVTAGKMDAMTYTKTRGMFQRPSQIVLRCTSTRGRENFAHNNDPYYDALVSQFDAVTTIDEAEKLFIEADMYTLAQHSDETKPHTQFDKEPMGEERE